MPTLHTNFIHKYPILLLLTMYIKINTSATTSNSLINGYVFLCLAMNLLKSAVLLGFEGDFILDIFDFISILFLLSLAKSLIP